MSFRFPWQSLSGKLPRDDVNKLAIELERRLQAIEMNFDTVEPVIGAPTFRRLYIPTTETTHSAAFTTLTTPDQVKNVPMPTGGLICVSYQAMWKKAVAVDQPQAAIFLNENQIKVAESGLGTPGASAAEFGGVGGSGQYAPLASCPLGLIGGTDDGLATPYTGDATTGQAVGMVILSSADNRNGAINVGASRVPTATGPDVWGGACLLFATADTYTVSIRFKSVTGDDITVKERKLAVWTVGASSGQPA